MGPRASAAVPALTEILVNENHEQIIRSDATVALGRIGHAGGVEALMNALDDPTGMVCANAADALGDIGPAARAAVPRLLELLDDEQVSGTRMNGEKITVASEAWEALRKIDPEAAEKAGLGPPRQNPTRRSGVD